MRILFFIFRYLKTKCRNFQILRPNRAWDLCKPLKLMFAILGLPLASAF